MKSFIISLNDANQRLDKFIAKSVPLLPAALLYKYIRLKRIKVNRKRADVSLRLCEGDLVELYIGDEFFAPAFRKYDFMTASSKLNILHEDENILLLDKKVGLLCHPDEKEYGDTLISRVKRYLYEKGEYLPDEENSFVPSLVNRIDRNTGGIVIAAKNASSLRILNEKMKNREIRKFYLCIVHGKMPKNADILEAYLEKNEDKNKVYIHRKEASGAKHIRTYYRVLNFQNNYSLLEIELLTGRTHQIRAHMASVGHPLLGDGKYGIGFLNKEAGFKKQMLYSFKLTFDFKESAGALEYLNGQTFEVPDVWFSGEFEKIARSQG